MHVIALMLLLAVPVAVVSGATVDVHASGSFEGHLEMATGERRYLHTAIANAGGAHELHLHLGSGLHRLNVSVAVPAGRRVVLSGASRTTTAVDVGADSVLAVAGELVVEGVTVLATRQGAHGGTLASVGGGGLLELRNVLVRERLPTLHADPAQPLAYVAGAGARVRIAGATLEGNAQVWVVGAGADVAYSDVRVRELNGRLLRDTVWAHPYTAVLSDVQVESVNGTGARVLDLHYGDDMAHTEVRLAGDTTLRCASGRSDATRAMQGRCGRATHIAETVTLCRDDAAGPVLVQNLRLDGATRLPLAPPAAWALLEADC